MTELNLSDNPLGEAGARSLFRKMVQDYDFKCVILMRDCTYAKGAYGCHTPDPSIHLGS